MQAISYAEAIRRGLDEELKRDSEVVIIGEDVAVGGPFGVTKGLVDVHGSCRVRNTPISEACIMGMGVGAALRGMRPVLEIMFMDFITLGLDALVNQAAKYRFMSNGQLSVPLVVRTQAGAGGGAGAQHSQSLEAWLAHVPGLVVLAPGSGAEAYGLLKSAIRCDDPVVFIEHKRLYSSRDTLPEEELAIPIGKARVVREGADVTLLAYSYMVTRALEAAEVAMRKGHSVEVIDLRTLCPLDMETAGESIAKTHRAIVVHEAVRVCGLGAEIAARIGEEFFDELDAPVRRVGAPFVPVPFSSELEQALLPDVAEITKAVDEVML